DDDEYRRLRSRRDPSRAARAAGVQAGRERPAGSNVHLGLEKAPPLARGVARNRRTIFPRSAARRSLSALLRALVRLCSCAASFAATSLKTRSPSARINSSTPRLSPRAARRRT